MSGQPILVQHGAAPPPGGTLGPIPRPRRSGGGDALPSEEAPGLNERDLELLRHLADGKSTPQIAAAMSVTSNTARTRVRRVQRKLATPQRRRVVEKARELGVI